MVQEQEWQKWQERESATLGELIAWACTVFSTPDAGIEEPRHYGTALLAHSIECARSIRLCIGKGLPGPAFAIARAQYEGALRGHIIVNEINLEELTELLDQTRRWWQNRQTQESSVRSEGPPRIEIRGKKWSILPKIKAGSDAGRGRPLRREFAKIWQESVEKEMRVLHDLAHSGLTHAFQMLDEDRYIGPCYSSMNQTLLLCLAQKTTMFAIMAWPGAEQNYSREIECRAINIAEQWKAWQIHIGMRS